MRIVSFLCALARRLGKQLLRLPNTDGNAITDVGQMKLSQPTGYSGNHESARVTCQVGEPTAIVACVVLRYFYTCK